LGNTKAGSQGPTPLLMPLVKSLYEEDPRVWIKPWSEH
jgi:hypothetical protein